MYLFFVCHRYSSTSTSLLICAVCPSTTDLSQLHDTIGELEDQLLEAVQAREEAERVAASSQKRYQAELQIALKRAQEAEGKLVELQHQQQQVCSKGRYARSYTAVVLVQINCFNGTMHWFLTQQSHLQGPTANY